MLKVIEYAVKKNISSIISKLGFKPLVNLKGDDISSGDAYTEYKDINF